MNDWISIGDRLPERIRSNPAEFPFVLCDEEQNWYDEEWLTDTVTHWMPLPEPPE